MYNVYCPCRLWILSWSTITTPIHFSYTALYYENRIQLFISTHDICRPIIIPDLHANPIHFTVNLYIIVSSQTLSLCLPDWDLLRLQLVFFLFIDDHLLLVARFILVSYPIYNWGRNPPILSKRCHTVYYKQLLQIQQGLVSYYSCMHFKFLYAINFIAITILLRKKMLIL